MRTETAASIILAVINTLGLIPLTYHVFVVEREPSTKDKPSLNTYLFTMNFSQTAIFVLQAFIFQYSNDPFSTGLPDFSFEILSAARIDCAAISEVCYFLYIVIRSASLLDVCNSRLNYFLNVMKILLPSLYALQVLPTVATACLIANGTISQTLYQNIAAVLEILSTCALLSTLFSDAILLYIFVTFTQHLDSEVSGTRTTHTTDRHFTIISRYGAAAVAMLFIIVPFLIADFVISDFILSETLGLVFFAGASVVWTILVAMKIAILQDCRQRENVRQKHLEIVLGKDELIKIQTNRLSVVNRLSATQRLSV